MEIKPLSSRQDLLKFIKFPFELYGADPLWVAPLISEQLKFFDPHKNPYFQHSKAQLWLAIRSGKVVGRISAQTNRNHNKEHQDRVGFFGFFETIDEQAVADALLETAQNWLRAQGLDIMRGPANFSVNDQCGLLIDGFSSPPLLLMSYNPPYYRTLLENYGFRKAMDMYAYQTEVRKPPEKLKKLADKIEAKGNFTIRALKSKNKRKLRSDLEKIFAIYEDAWQKNWGYVPMSPAEFEQLVNTLLPIAIPELIFIAEIAGKAVGLSVTLPDYNFILQKMKGKILPLGWLKFFYYKAKIPTLRVTIMGVLPQYKLRGIDVVMYYKSFQAAYAHKNQFKSAEFSWVLESNEMMNKVATSLGGKIYKTYRFYDLQIFASTENGGTNV